MKQEKREAIGSQRRRFFGLLGGLAAGVLLLPLVRRRELRELSLKEADFYRPHKREESSKPHD